MQRDKFTFHSPDTQFKHPFLSAKEVKIYDTLYGEADGVFNEVYKHPEHKLISDYAFIIASFIGMGIAIKGIRGNFKTHTTTSAVPDATTLGTGSTNIVGTLLGIGFAGVHNALYAATSASELLGTEELQAITTGSTGLGSALYTALELGQITAASVSGSVSSSTKEYSTNGETGLPGPLALLQHAPVFIGYWSEGTQAFVDLIKAFSRTHQYALAYESHCFYNQGENITPYTGFRTKLEDGAYIGDKLQEFNGVTVNNLYRGACVALTTDPTRPVPDPIIKDNTRKTIGQAFGVVVSKDNVGKQVPKGALDFTQAGIGSGHYVGIKQRLRNQYGQMDGIRQLPTGSCMKLWAPDPNNPPNATSDVIFGGDTYISRYTEKNTFFYFYDWITDFPDEFEYDYRLRKMVPMPTYWMDTHDFQVDDFIQGLQSMLTDLSGSGTGVLPGGWHNFDTSGLYTITSPSPSSISTPPFPIIIKEAYMYLFNSGVRDFYVESEVNVSNRDWDDDEDKRHYDPGLHTALKDIFRSDIIKAGNFFKYDYSLSASRFFQGYPSWGRMQYRNYDPEVASTCYTYYPNRLIYSLPQNLELRYDNWLAYLVNNYKDFTSRTTTIKPIGKNGAMILFESEAPAIIPGVDTLQTSAGTKITIGDGGLFSQPLQNIVNTDTSYEYGSCQDKLSVINTPAGLYWISQNQGKIFSYSGQLSEISQQGMKWWFDEFLPYKIVEDFPDFELLDNTVIGVGCQSVYDNSDSIIYFTKRDFKLKPEFKDRVTYNGSINFSIGAARFLLGDPRYFDNASWTVSYDPKAAAWISFHDWHPNFLLPSKNNFMSIANEGIWKHNDRDDSFCNFYGVNYPFEVELVTPTGQSVNTLKSIEYLMEVYQWDQDNIDRNHVLDFNFDKAVVYNTEQMSGELRLNISPKNNAPALLNYPQVNPTSIDILYSKEEQKYRFNQFWDITDDRGEFTNARRMMWLTSPNGYAKEINPLYVNYAKPAHQRKKFRHYQSNVWLRRMISGVHNMQLKLVNSKNQYSPR